MRLGYVIYMVVKNNISGCVNDICDCVKNSFSYVSLYQVMRKMYLLFLKNISGYVKRILYCMKRELLKSVLIMKDSPSLFVKPNIS